MCVKPMLVALAIAAMALPAATASATVPLRVQLVSGPPAHPVAGVPWRLAVRVQRGTKPYTGGAAPVVSGRGDVALTARLGRTSRRGVYAATVSFPTSGPWILEAVVARRRFALGIFAVDVPVNAQVREPFAVTALPDNSLLIGQRQGPLLRWSNGQLTTFAGVQPVHNLSLTPGGVVLAAENARLHRLTTAGAVAQPPLVFDADPVAAGDAAGNVYVAFYENRVVRVDATGHVTPLAGTGEEGFGGDGGPATQAKLFHPHDVAVGGDGKLYIADTENGRIRRVDPATGVITSFGGNVGIPVSLDVGPDGAVYSVGVARGSTPGGVWRTTAEGSTPIAQGADLNGVTVAPDGTVYVVQWQQWRIARIDPRTRLIRTILRGTPNASRRLQARPKLRIPYDIERDSAGRLWIADGGRHQVLRYVPRTRKLTAVAPRAGWDEVVDIVFDRARNAYVSDVSRGRVRRIAPNGTVTTAAELEAPAALSLDPTGRYIAISSLAGSVRRLDLTSGRLDLLVREGLTGPHGLAYDREGNLFICDPPDRLLKLSAATGALTVVARTSIFRVKFAPDGRLFAIGGSQTGGRVKRINVDGSVTVVAGTGGTTRYRDGVQATRVGIGPTAIEFLSNRIVLVAQTLPAPAIRRVDLATGIITTFLRGR